MNQFDIIQGEGVPIQAWTRGVPVEEKAEQQLRNVASLPFVHHHVAVMPDVHWGYGATVGSVIPAKGAIIPAAVGVDIGCGMMAVQTSLTSQRLPDNLQDLRNSIERAVPHGRTGRGHQKSDRGAWGNPPDRVAQVWSHGSNRKGSLEEGFDRLVEAHPKLRKANHVHHLGTLGTGNHFIEICLDEADRVWVMLHSGSRGVGNRIGTYFIELARKDMERYFINLPDRDLAYFPEGTDHFDDYVQAVSWAQAYALANREVMMDAVLAVMGKMFRRFDVGDVAVNCHHNYVAREQHFGAQVWVTRKGAVSARKDELGIIPGSMGARSYIVRGRGNKESFCSCSHGAGRLMSRGEARQRFTLADHRAATEGVECRKDKEVIDETPQAYKDIDAVMAAQTDLVEVVHTLKQVVCVKG
ncbi:RtcB family protein [Magnetospira sp. QH-2]|uniref:RtcB family protein n=1 Tax=Magnetospira sp. (strain QH-2) TaxID=1288970 RepID=UPI0003E813C9|nr:RtcB family protein [Magnetospira sp. QH-2]CCQ74999.1 conserved protein of unknown function [Magnetospira sp. QH-2]